MRSIPYCGLPPLPAEIWTRWNIDPLLLVALAALMVWHGLRLRRTGSRVQHTFFIAGWWAVVLAFVSPLCALGVALFSARVTQHMWITMLAAPLLALATARTSRAMIGRRRPWAMIGRRRPMAIIGRRRPTAMLRCRPMAAAGSFALALWGWHFPALYDLTFRSDLAYWLMHISLGGAALLLWRALIRGAADQWLARLCAGFVTIVHMGLLGALITLAPRTLYQSHLLTSGAWGLTPLEDQQLGGLIMWVPAAAALLVGGLSVLYGVLAGGDAARSAYRSSLTTTRESRP